MNKKYWAANGDTYDENGFIMDKSNTWSGHFGNDQGFIGSGNTPEEAETDADLASEWQSHIMIPLPHDKNCPFCK